MHIWRDSMKLNIGFIYGGKSTEHEISVISAVQAMSHIDKEKYEAIPIYISKDSKMYTSDILKDMKTYKDLNNLKKKCNEIIITKKDEKICLIKNSFPYKTVAYVDLFFPVMHGYNTEDGSLEGYLETLDVPYCESDMFACVIGQDKVFQKAVLKENGINVVPYVYFYEYEYLNDEKNILNKCENLDYPLIIKPARQGSSIGIGFANNREELIECINEAIMYDEKIIVEKVIKDLQELNCSVLGGLGDYKASVIEEVFPSEKILSYEDKYLSDSKTKGMASLGRKIPAEINKSLEKEVKDISLKACRALNTNGIVRIDFLVDKKENKVYLNELNIIPGSLAFYLWTPLDKQYKELLNDIIEYGIKRSKNKARKLNSFDTNVLEGFNGVKGVKK